MFNSPTVRDVLIRASRGGAADEDVIEEEEVIQLATDIESFYRHEPTTRGLADLEDRLWAECPPGTPRTLQGIQQAHYAKLRTVVQIMLPHTTTQTQPVWGAVNRQRDRAFATLARVSDAVSLVPAGDDGGGGDDGEGVMGVGDDDGAAEGEAAEDDMSRSARKQDEYYRALLGAMNGEDYALYGGRVYRKVWTGEGVNRHFTHCYRPLSATSVEVLVSTYSQQVHSKPDLYAMALQANEERAIRLLTRADPDKVEGVTVYAPKRHLFSCRDGVLSVGDPISLTPWDQVEPGTQTANYFDIEARPIMDEMLAGGVLETPAIDTILSTQGIEPRSELYRCFLALCIGRLCHTMQTGHNAGDATVFGDAWQIVPILVGKGGTGKSSIVENFLMKIYGRDNVAVVGEGTEPRYLLDVFEGKLMWVAAEVGETFPLGQQMFQQIVSNETATIRKIFGTQRPFTFDMPGFMSSNTGLPYVDREQSQKRRLVPFPFLRAVPVQNQDPAVGAGLRDMKQFLRLLIKSNLCYHWLKQRVRSEAGGRFHEWLRKNCDESGHYFLKGQMKTLANKDTLVAFLNDACFESRTLVLDPGSQRGERTYYISLDDLKEMGNEWQQQNHMERITWDATNVANTVALLDAVWARGERIYPPGEGSEVQEQVYIVGLAKREHLGHDVNWTVLRRRWLIQATVVRLGKPGTDDVETTSIFWTVESEGAFRRFKRLEDHARPGADLHEACLEDVDDAINDFPGHVNCDPSPTLVKSCDGNCVHRTLYYYPQGDDDDDDGDGDSQMTPLQ